jgi:DNA-binding HxlR family transcriptional regulator
MDQEIIDRYLKEVPFEIRNAVKPLDDDKTWAILIVLLKNGKLRFSDIKTTFNAKSSGEINRQLNRLADAGLIEKYSMKFKDIGHAKKTYYRPTYLSKTLISALFENLSLKPKIPEPKTVYEQLWATGPIGHYELIKGDITGPQYGYTSPQPFEPLKVHVQLEAEGEKDE